jgi:tRNA(fMet)-specific endonuclease VapC
VRYLLDTNACIALINRKPGSVRTRLDHALRGGAEAFVSAVAAFELWYGAAKGKHQEKNAKRVEMFFAGPIGLLPFEEEDARSAGNVRATLEAAGRPIGTYNVLIAGQALRRKLTLVTANVREFRRIKGLLWEDWARG